VLVFLALVLVLVAHRIFHNVLDLLGMCRWHYNKASGRFFDPNFLDLDMDSDIFRHSLLATSLQVSVLVTMFFALSLL
jgi:hypothetical protein